MRSQRQIAANRRNGKKGGPKTQAGKERSRLSSLKHGLTSTTLVVLPEEHEHEYQEVLRGFRASFNPYDSAEETLVERLAQTQWRTLRSRRVETGILKVTADAQRREARELVENCPDNLNPHEAIGVAFMTMPDEHWKNYMRYDTAISRDFFKTLDALQKLQRTRELRKPVQPLLALAAGQTVGQAVSPAHYPLSENGIRFVSQNRTSAAKPNEQNTQPATPKQHSVVPRQAANQASRQSSRDNKPAELRASATADIQSVAREGSVIYAPDTTVRR